MKKRIKKLKKSYRQLLKDAKAADIESVLLCETADTPIFLDTRQDDRTLCEIARQNGWEDAFVAIDFIENSERIITLRQHAPQDV